MKTQSLFGVILFAIACALMPAHAQDTAWTNKTGNWSVPGNWSPNVPPGPGTNAFLTNYAAGLSYTVTNDVPGNTFAGLAIFNTNSAGVHTLFSDGNGLYATGDAFIGRNGSLVFSNATFSFGGSVTVSNAGSIYITTNAVLNVGGTNQASANASGVALTNLAGGLIELGRPRVYGPATINASTVSVGVVNRGTIRGNASDHYVLGIINAAIFNDTNGVITTSTLFNTLELSRVPTNRGRITIANSSPTLKIMNGNVVNEGLIENVNGGVFSILNGALINASNAMAMLNGGGTFSARSTLNYGSLVVSNSMNSGATPNLGGPVTNYGSMVLFRLEPPAGVPNLIYTFTASNVVNYGVIRAMGSYGILVTNWNAGNPLALPVTNQVGGVIVSTNGCVLMLTTLQNNGTLVVHSNSVLALGFTFGIPGKILAGTSTFQNDGAITLQGGNFGARLLTNSAAGTLQGQGEMGQVTLSNVVSASQATTNFVRFFAVKGVFNSGLLAPNGTINAGALTNRSGGKIAGTGNIRSIDTTNYYSGETLVISNINQRARIANEAGATILADGGTLALENGFVGDTQSGTIGATNGGVLRVGDGTQSLTNQGAIWLSNGRLECGDLAVTNGTVSIDLDALASSTNGLIQTANLTLGGSGILSLTGAGHKAILFRYTGSRSGVFGSVTGVPPGYRLYYGAEADGDIRLVPAGATIILIK